MSKWMNGQQLIAIFESFAPKSLAVEGDKVGLMIGTLNKPIKKVMFALDVLEEVIDEAIEEEVDLIIAHHPLIFRPLKKIDTDTVAGRMIEKSLKHQITIYAAHTNLDIANGGVNDMMAEALGLKQCEVLSETKRVKLKKLVVFVPEADADRVREAVASSGAGHIGNYSHCTFNSEGVGTFLPLDGTNPYIGQQGKLEKVKELKIEAIVPEHLQNKVIRAMLKAHPYEEVAYDLYPLDNVGEPFGLGRIGYLEEEMTLKQFAEHVKKAFDVPAARVVGHLDAKVKKVAVLGGDGNKYVSAAQFKGADVLVTGDVYYHVAHDAMMEGLHIVDPGHNVEKIMKETMKRWLSEKLADKKVATEVISSKVNTDPFTFI